ncbi:hypothetical protein LBMAG42_22420 [Deltaproteobacteria bacterium]|nr:hypothetical protein LBMAG42_22420 [Deltaproteobacteria bacterium]
MHLLLLQLALAAPVDVLRDESVARAISGDCPGAEPGLIRRTEAIPDDLGARLVLDACRYGGTQRGMARSDLASLYNVSAPYDPGVLLKRRDSTAADVARLRREAQLALGTLVRAMVAAKEFEEAQEALAQLEPQVGESGATAALRLLIERSQNGAAPTWSLAAQTFGAYPDDPDVVEELARLTFDDAGHAAPEMLDAIFARGRSTAKFNALLGMLRNKDGAGCLARAARFSVPESERATLDAIRYRCAVAAPDLRAADALVGTSRTALDARTQALHARLLADNGRYDEALALLEPKLDAEPLAVEVALEVYAKQGRGDKVEALAADQPAGSTARLSAATALASAKQYAPALLLVEGTCAAYSGKNAALCTKLVDVSHRGLGR